VAAAEAPKEREREADTHVWRVPASNGAAAAHVREACVVALNLPAIASYKAIAAVGAGHNGHGARSFVVARIVGDC